MYQIKNRYLTIGKQPVYVMSSRTEVTKQNYAVLQLLEIIRLIDLDELDEVENDNLLQVMRWL